MRSSNKAKLDELDAEMDVYRYHRGHLIDFVVSDPPMEREYWRMAKEQFALVKGNFDALPKYNPYTAYPRTRPGNLGANISILTLRELKLMHRSLMELGELEQLGQLTEKIRDECGFMQMSCYESLLLPYLRTVSQLMKTHGMSSQDSDHRALFTSVLHNYTLRAQRFAANVHDCAHLQERLGLRPGSHSEHADYVTMIEKRGSPHKLIVEKTHRASERDHKEWKARGKEVDKRVREVLGGPAELKALLGGAYKQIMRFKIVRLPSAEDDPSEPDEANLRAVCAGDVTPILHLNEPERTRRWLRFYYVPNASSYEAETCISSDYRDAFRDEQWCTEPRLDNHELYTLAVEVFAGFASRGIERLVTDRTFRQGPPNPGYFDLPAIKGIRRRRLAGTDEQIGHFESDDDESEPELQRSSRDSSEDSEQRDEDAGGAVESAGTSPRVSEGTAEAAATASRAPLRDVTNSTIAHTICSKRKQEDDADIDGPPAKRKESGKL
ncbi:hypothetical protein LTS10_008941 [Elasticomyces elasticus]|nr:hypothetical protein LTS10_008941 [Elasticomyces elasticus]